MPFPPAFSNAWDNTVPPDTQAANQLGADLRTFRTDVQQRFSLLSGTLANQPTNMDASFGGAGFGTLYFATDTGQIFQWNGAAWVDVTTTLVGGGHLSNAVAVVTNAPNTDGIIITIPANALIVGNILNIHVEVFGNPVDSIQLFFGSTSLDVYAVTGSSTKFEFDITVLITGAATQKISVSGNCREAGTPATWRAIASTAAINGVEAINAPIIVKTRAISGLLSTHNFMTITWR